MKSFDVLINNIEIDYLINKIKERSLYIWGASVGGEKLHYYLSNNNVIVNMIIDKEIKEFSEQFRGIKIESPEVLENINNKPFILIAINYYYEVEEFLIKCGYVETVDYVYLLKPHKIINNQKYTDIYGNKFDICYSKNLQINFIGCNSKIIIGENCDIEAEFECFDGQITIEDCVRLIGKVECKSESDVILKSQGSINADITCGYNSSIQVGKRCSFSENTYIYCLHNSYIKMKNDNMFGYNAFITCNFNGRIEFGVDCLMSTNVSIICGDGHPIIDMENKKLINSNQTILIGNHVWIGTKASVLGGSFIDDGSVIGANSLVKDKFTKNCIIAGCPAKTVRKNIIWERELANLHEMTNSSGNIKKENKKL